jgi:glutamyl/glutaminyl-tRNA synthetase
VTQYRGRFAPSPTGPLHAGSLVAALASWLDARAANGVWIVRIEDLDPPRVVPGVAQNILQTLARCGLESEEPVVFQSARGSLYEAALDRLQAAGLIYGCACSRSDVDTAIEAGRLASTPAPARREHRRASRSARTECACATKKFRSSIARPVGTGSTCNARWATLSSGAATVCGPINSPSSSMTRLKGLPM